MSKATAKATGRTNGTGRKAGAKAKRSLAGAKNLDAQKARSGANNREAVSSAAKSASAPLDLDKLLPDGKLYYRIGEVSEITGVKAYVLRYWESEFRWMSPQKSRSKQRLYRRKDIEMILLIRTLLYEERYTIAGARLRLRELGAGKPGKPGNTGKSGRPGKADKTAGNANAKQLAATRDPVVDTTSSPLSHEDTSSRDRFRQIKKELIAIRASL
jgi:DNA-binding transcriptional MerR regulator